MLRAKTDGIVPTPIRRGTPPGGDGAVWRQRWGHGAANDVIATRGTQRARARVVLLLFSPKSSWGGGEGSFRRVGGGLGGRVPRKGTHCRTLPAAIRCRRSSFDYQPLSRLGRPNRSERVIFPIQICRFQTSVASLRHFGFYFRAGLGTERILRSSVKATLILFVFKRL